LETGAGPADAIVRWSSRGKQRSASVHPIARQSRPRQKCRNCSSAAILQGYGWCVRKGDYLNVGLGRFDERSLPAVTDRFASFLVKIGRIPSHCSWRGRGHSYAVQTARSTRRIVDDRVVLIGDAAGVADRKSGEGIRQAVESGLLAAEMIVDANGRLTRDRLESYAAAVMAKCGTPSMCARIVTRPACFVRSSPSRIDTVARETSTAAFQRLFSSSLPTDSPQNLPTGDVLDRNIDIRYRLNFSAEPEWRFACIPCPTHKPLNRTACKEGIWLNERLRLHRASARR
jgi:hypothetical protein